MNRKHKPRMIEPPISKDDKFWKEELSWRDYQKLRYVKKKEWLKKWFSKPATANDIAALLKKLKEK